MGSEFRYTLEKVLGTQDHPNLRLASHHYVLRPDLIKSIFNTYVYTHTHTSIHLSIQYGIFITKQHTYPSTQTKENQTYQRNPSIYLSCENLS